MKRKDSARSRVTKTSVLLTLLVLIPSFGYGQSEVDNYRIRQVDFHNFTYQPYCGGDLITKSVEVRKGVFSLPWGDQVTPSENFINFKVSTIVYGDLTGDKRDEAVVVTLCNTGGTATFSEGFIYTIKNRRIQSIARLKDKDVALGGVVKVQIIDGLLKVQRSAPTEQAPHCCPDYVATTTYRWDSYRLIRVGLVERRKVDAGK